VTTVGPVPADGGGPPPRERTVAENAWALLLLAAFQTTFYMTMNHVQWFPARSLPLTPLDRTVPFLPWTVVPYMLLLWLGPLPILFVRRRATFRRALVAYGLCVLVTGACFTFWPTACPRPVLSARHDGWDARMYRLLTLLDTPACAFPSMHIILPTICAWVALRERQRYAVPFAVFLALLVPSVLTTKQHYLVDVLAGFAIPVAAIWIAGRILGAGAKR
jgi:hypothetical protein